MPDMPDDNEVLQSVSNLAEFTEAKLLLERHEKAQELLNHSVILQN